MESQPWWRESRTRDKGWKVDQEEEEEIKHLIKRVEKNTLNILNYI